MPLIPATLDDDLYQTFGRLAAENRAGLVEIGGVADHVHLVLTPHQGVPVADLMRPLKNESTYWMRERLGDAAFFAWQRGYGAFSVSSSRLPIVCEYVRCQKEHHQTTSTEDEFRSLLAEHGLDVNKARTTPGSS